MKRTGVVIVLGLGLIGVAIWGWNFKSLQEPLDGALAGDPRNVGIQARAHFESYIQPAVVVFDLRLVNGDKTPTDVFRVLLQFAEAVKATRFERVVLAHGGTPKFMLDGAYFQRLGEEYSAQNPVFTMRTFPGELLRLDGTPAFSKWEGGLLGVMKEQFEDFNEFHRQWYIDAPRD